MENKRADVDITEQIKKGINVITEDKEKAENLIQEANNPKLVEALREKNEKRELALEHMQGVIKDNS